MTNEIDRSSYRLEVAAKLDRLACDLQTANAAIIDYASSLLGGDDHAIDENAMMAIKVGGKIAGKAHLLRDIAERLETADKDEARQRDGTCLFEILRQDGYLGKSGSNRNVPTQKAMDLGLFRIKETAVTHSDGHVTISRTPKVTGKGQRYFIARYCPKKKPND